MPLTYLKASIRGYARGSRKDSQIFKLIFKRQASSFIQLLSKAVKEALKHVVLEGALVTLLNTGIVHSVKAKPGSRCDINVHWVTVRVNPENRCEITN